MLDLWERQYLLLYYRHFPLIKKAFFISTYEFAKAKRELKRNIVKSGIFARFLKYWVVISLILLALGLLIG